MGVLSRIFASGASVTTSAELAEEIRGRGYETESGALVTYDAAMRVADVYKCIRLVSEDLAKLPLHIYRRLERGKERARDYWLNDLFDAPNPMQTGFEFRETMQSHIELAGNAYAIKTVVRNETRELIPVIPTRVRVELVLSTMKLLYQVTMPDGTTVPVPAERMFHLRGLSLDGLVGLSPIQYHRETVGLSMQLVKHGAKLFRNGANIGGVLEHPNKMSDESYDRLKNSFDEKYSGVDNSHKTVLLEEGTKFTKVGMTSEDAQFLESRKYARADIAGIFRVPPHKIGDLERATFSNVEQQSIDYGTDSLMPRATRWEARIARDLIPPGQRATIYAEIQLQGLLRGDYAARTNGYRSAILAGWMTRNEARELENLNPLPGLDEPLTPLNMNEGGVDPTTPPDEKKVTP